MSVSQTDFTRAILDPSLTPPAGLTNPDGVAASKRFDVYRNNVASSLIDALETAFPVIQKLLGEAFFKALAGVYYRQFPPGSPLLMFYGEDMPGFLERFEPVQKLGYLPDVARLELALRRSYHAADAAPLAPETFQALPPDRLMQARVSLAPAVRLVRSAWPIHGIWRFNMEPDAPQPQGAGEDVLLTRPGFDPQLATLPPGGGAFVAALVTGNRFGEAVEAATTDAAEFDLAQTLGVLFAGAAITKLNEDTT